MHRLSVLLAMAFILALWGGAASAGICDNEVMTEEGPVLGYSEPEVDVCGYKGIPYAAPPVGELRWKEPQPPEQRSRTLEALDWSPRCVSGGGGSGAPASMLPEQSEDCLYLNVWRPEKSGTFPVMFWIHGGSLTVGTAAEPIYWGERLSARQDVVVVSINYRLNYYGFLAHPELSGESPYNSSGNYGLLDQVAALEWVRDNIANFGGDPGNVTIFGESAGGWSVCNLLACPLAEGLYHQAVIQSGGCDMAKPLEEGHEDGLAFAGKLGCSGKDQAACMRRLGHEEIAELIEEANKGEDEGLSLTADEIKFTWIPKVDGRALEAVPKEALRSGEFSRVPVMVGSNRDEAMLFAVAMPGVRLAPRSTVRKVFGKMLGEEVMAGVEEHYSWSDYRRPVDMALDAGGDMALGCPCWEAAEAASDYVPVYYYRFDYDNHLMPHMVGAAHGVEIPFIFGNLDRFPANVFLTKYHEKKYGRPASDAMAAYWANFARTGDPNGAGLPEWPAYGHDRMRMYLDVDSRARPTDNVDKCMFWRESGAGIN